MNTLLKKRHPTFPVSPTDVAGWAILAAIWTTVAFHYPDLQEIIPIHYNTAGEADGFGSKKYILLLPLAATLLSVGLTFLSKRLSPEPTAESTENTDKRVAYHTIRTVRLLLTVLFGWIAFKTIRDAGIATDTFGFWGIPLFATLSVLFYAHLKTASRSKKNR